jgi:hypothetical protein
LEAAQLQQQVKSLSIDLEHFDAIRKALSNSSMVPFVWDIAFVEIFGGEKQGFDIVIGNPPYVRQEKISDPSRPREEVTTQNKKEYKGKLIRSVYQAYPDFFGYNPSTGNAAHKMNAKSDLYIYFYFHGLSLLNKKGSFCFITSNSWLDVGYGKDLQEFLLKHSHVKMVIDNQKKRTFPGADVNTVIVVLSPPDESEEWGLEKTARFVMFKEPFENILHPVIFEEIDEADDRASKEEYRVHPITQEALLTDGCEMPEQEVGAGFIPAHAHGPLIKVAKYIGNKWGGKYLRAPDIYWTILEKGKGKLVRLGDIAEVRFGIKTGANEFFYLDEARIKEWGIEEEFLKPVIKSPRECKRILIDPKDLKFKIFMCHKDKRELKGTSALEYIKWGESQGFDERPSCSGRPKWWDLGVRRFPPIISPSSISEYYRTFKNVNVYADKRLYEIYPNDDIDLVVLGTNVIMFSFFLELASRTGLGEGLIDLAVYELADSLVVKSINIDNVFEVIIENSKRTLLPLVDEIAHPQRKVLDDIIFDVLNLTHGEREAVYEAIIELVETRLKKADSLRPSNRRNR